jgi:hypothetical protein
MVITHRLGLEEVSSWLACRSALLCMPLAHPCMERTADQGRNPNATLPALLQAPKGYKMFNDKSASEGCIKVIMTPPASRGTGAGGGGAAEGAAAGVRGSGGGAAKAGAAPAKVATKP